MSIDLAAELRDRFNWKQVEAPGLWRPDDIGEELIGYYGGRTLRTGPHGQYEVVIVHVPQQGAFMLSGTMIIQLIDDRLNGWTTVEAEVD